MPLTLPLGSRRSTRGGYIQIKAVVGQRRWPFEHRVVWAKAHGPVPVGSVIHHKNGIRTDNRLENLELCKSNSAHFLERHADSMRENMRRVGIAGRGRPKSAETRAKMSAAQKKLKALPPETQKLIAALRGSGLSMTVIAERVFGSRRSVARVLRCVHGSGIDDTHAKTVTKYKRYITIGGQTKPITEWCRHLRISQMTVYYRLRCGLSIEESLFTPVDRKYSTKKARPSP